jgi:hypothetical protein
MSRSQLSAASLVHRGPIEVPLQLFVVVLVVMHCHDAVVLEVAIVNEETC